MNKLKIAIISTLLALPLISYAEDEDVQEELIVIAARIPTVASDVIGSVDSISSEDISAQMIDGLEQLVRFIPGISAHKESQYGRSLTKGLHIRGIHGGEIYLIDGVRISDSYIGYGRDIVDTDLLKKVEITKGPTSVEYGSDALAGTVAYYTKAPSDLANLDERYLSINTSFDNSNQQQKINLLAAYVGNKTEGLIQVVDRSLEETELHQDFTLKANPLEGDQKSLLAKLVVAPSSDSKITFVADFQKWESVWSINSDYGFIYFPSPRAITSSAGDDEGSRERLNLEFDWSNANTLYDEASLKIYSQETEQSQITIQNQVSFFGGMQAAPTPTMRIRDFDFNQTIRGFTFQAFKTQEIHQMVYGLDVETTETERPRMLTEINLLTQVPSFAVDGETYPNKTFPDTETKRKAVFFNDRISLSDTGFLNLGFRYDDYELNPKPDMLLQNANILNYQIRTTEDNALSMKIGYLNDIREGLTAFAQYAEGFKAPNYENSNTVFTNYLFQYTVQPNPNLEAEESQSYEVGLRGFRDFDSWELALYNNKVDGFIRYAVVGFSQGLGVYQYQNAENVDIKGLEFNYDRVIKEGLALKVALALSSGDETSTTGGSSPMIEIDPKELIVGLKWNSLDERWGLQGLLTLVDKSKNNLEPVCLNNSCDPRFVSAGYGLFDVFASYNPKDKIEFRLAFENITDKKYHRWASVAQLPANDKELDLYGQSGRSISASFKYVF